MITNREMFCAVAGSIMAKVEKSKQLSVIYQAGVVFGVDKKDIADIMKDIVGSLEYTITKMIKEYNGKKDFGV